MCVRKRKLFKRTKVVTRGSFATEGGSLLGSVFDAASGRDAIVWLGKVSGATAVAHGQFRCSCRKGAARIADASHFRDSQAEDLDDNDGERGR